MNAHASPPRQGMLPETPVARWLRPLVRFLQIESAGGIMLLICTLLALGLANSPWGGGFAQLWQIRLGFTVGGFELMEPLLFWVNDGLMTIFFFVAGLEIKRELVEGELREWRKAALPVLAALGGMLAPAAIYLLVRAGRPGHQGWGIPMATDIAFVVGFLAILGARVPVGLKIVLLSLAIADDIGAVLVIALFYSTHVSLAALGWAALGFALILVFDRIGVRRIAVYVFVSIGVWLAFVESGVHPTVAGVLLGLLTPARARTGHHALADMLSQILARLRPGGMLSRPELQGRSPSLSRRESMAPTAPPEHHDRPELQGRSPSLSRRESMAPTAPPEHHDRPELQGWSPSLSRRESMAPSPGEHHDRPMFVQLETAAREAVSPLARLETALHPWVAFVIMPVFALANAGVPLDPAALGHPVALAVAAGLILGKPLGIVFFSWLAVRIGVARLPTGVDWKIMFGGGALAGIGFTMSLFITGLAFHSDATLLDAGKIGTLTGSAVSALLGSLLLLAFLAGRTASAADQNRRRELAHVD